MVKGFFYTSGIILYHLSSLKFGTSIFSATEMISKSKINPATMHYQLACEPAKECLASCQKGFQPAGVCVVIPELGPWIKMSLLIRQRNSILFGKLTNKRQKIYGTPSN